MLRRVSILWYKWPKCFSGQNVAAKKWPTSLSEKKTVLDNAGRRKRVYKNKQNIAVQRAVCLTFGRWSLAVASPKTFVSWVPYLNNISSRAPDCQAQICSCFFRRVADLMLCVARFCATATFVYGLAHFFCGCPEKKTPFFAVSVMCVYRGNTYDVSRIYLSVMNKLDNDKDDKRVNISVQ